MERCSPTKMGKALKVVEAMKKAGLEFVPVPVKDDDHREELLKTSDSILKDMITGQD